MTQRILLLSPAFHGYWRAIGRALARNGSDVRIAVYDAPRSHAGRVRNKLLHDLPPNLQPEILRRRLTAEAIGVIRELRPEIAVVIKGDLFTDALWDELEARRVRRVVWLYDELRRTRHSAQRITQIGPIATYSRLDAEMLAEQGVRAAYVPLAFDDAQAFNPEPIGAVSLIGARYPERERLLRALDAARVPVRAYGPDWSRRPADVLRRRSFSDPGVPSSPGLDRGRAYGVLAGSRATLNVHNDQDGFTIRTFEAAGTGGVQLINRTDVGELYEPGTEVLPFSSDDEAIAIASRALSDTKWTSAIRERARRRTLAEHTFAHRARALEELWA